MEQRNITFIGAGNMAHAIIAGLIEGGYPASHIRVSSPTPVRRDAIAQQYGIISSDDNIACAKAADVIVLAVKPQMMQQVCESLQSQVDVSQKLILTIAAGIPVARYYAFFLDNNKSNDRLNIVRIMPNTPSLVGLGVSGLYAPKQVTEKDRQFTDSLMQSVGKTCWVDDENGINDIIALTGSSPAYFFLFMEAMQAEAERLGFSAQQARELILQTATGAAALAAKQSTLSFATLREQVTSKGGTTAEALRVFNEHNLSDTVAKAMQAAIKRAEEMEKSF